MPSATKWMIGAALLAVSAGAFAGDTAGTYMTFNRAVSDSTLPDGNHARLVWTWKVTDAGTDKCPSICGTFKWVEGYGSTSNATASGAWRQTHASKDGGLGTYTVTYKP